MSDLKSEYEKRHGLHSYECSQLDAELELANAVEQRFARLELPKNVVSKTGNLALSIYTQIGPVNDIDWYTLAVEVAACLLGLTGKELFEWADNNIATLERQGFWDDFVLALPGKVSLAEAISLFIKGEVEWQIRVW